MPKQHKIKRYHKKSSGTYKAKPHPLFFVFVLLVAGGLVFLGISIYEPVSKFILNLGRGAEPPPVSQPIENRTPSEPEEQEQEPQPQPGPASRAPDTLRAVELPLETAKNPAALTLWLDALPETANAVMVRLKEADGSLRYQSYSQSAAAWGATTEQPLDLIQLSGALRDRDLALVVWMSAFRDPIAARGDRERGAILHRTGPIWLDNAADQGGKPWLNPYSASARNYLVDLVGEVAEMGASLIILDDVCFPFDPTGGADFGDTEGLSRSEALARFLREASTVAEAGGARVVPYFPQQTVGDPATALADSDRYGGNPAALTEGELLIRFGVPGETAAATSLAAFPASVRERLIYALDTSVPGTDDLTALEQLGIGQFVCLATEAPPAA